MSDYDADAYRGYRTDDEALTSAVQAGEPLREPWRIEDDAQASWAMRKLRRATQQIERLDAEYERAVAELDAAWKRNREPHARTASAMEEYLSEWAVRRFAMVNDLDPAALRTAPPPAKVWKRLDGKTYAYPAGDLAVSRREAKLMLEADPTNPDLCDWLERMAPQLLNRRVRIKDFQDHLEKVDGIVVLRQVDAETGEVTREELPDVGQVEWVHEHDAHLQVNVRPIGESEESAWLPAPAGVPEDPEWTT